MKIEKIVRQPECSHSWDHMFEAGIIGGQFPVGWKCSKCGKFVDVSDVGVAGLEGVDSGRKILVGPHGVWGNCSDGSIYKQQIIHANGWLEIIR